tara:strand:- start:1599 stop:2369 length:771 start_codon:yes stop_codon:yes gene_type:complete
MIKKYFQNKMTSETRVKINGGEKITTTTYGNKWIWFVMVVLVVVGVAVGLSISLTNNESVTSNFNGFEVEYQNGTLVSNFNSYMESATSFWNNILNEPNDIRIQVKEESIESNILARARPFSSTNLKGGGIIYFNSNASYHDWDFVTKHELGHIFGIGSNQKWNNNIFQVDGKYYLSRLDFSETYQIYTDQFQGTSPGTPIGDARGHFDEDIFDTELMTPIAEAKGIHQPITLLTLTALKELGWGNIDLTQAEPFN